MLSKNFDSHRSLQQRFCIHVEDLNFFDISVYLSQRYYQPVLETFYQHKKVKLNRDVQYILISVPPCSHSSRLSYSKVLSPVIRYLYIHSTAPLPLEYHPRSLLTRKTYQYTITTTFSCPLSSPPSLVFSYIIYKMHAKKFFFQDNFFLYLDSILLKRRTSSTVWR